MAKLRLPKYRHNKQRGTAFVEFQGVRIGLGLYGSGASKAAYKKFLDEHVFSRSDRLVVAEVPAVRTVSQLLLAYLDHAQAHDPNHYDHFRVLAKVVAPRWGMLPVESFGPNRLREVRQALLARTTSGRPISRTHVNEQVQRLRRIFKWGASQEFFSVTVYQALATVESLRSGRSAATETIPKYPVDAGTVFLTVLHMPPTLRRMVTLHMLTGMRPDNVCSMRPAEIETGEAIWLYRPTDYKSKHLGRELVIPLGPQAQAILTEALHGIGPDQYIFSPRRVMAERLAERRANRKSKVPPSQQDRSKRRLKRPKQERYNAHSYRQAIQHAINLARKQCPELPDWTPIQLRKLRGTLVRHAYGLEGAQVALGHAKADVTQHYAERDAALARKIASETG